MLTLVAIKVDNSIWFEAKAVSNNFSLPPREKREGTNVQTPAPWRDVLETSPAGTLASRNPTGGQYYSESSAHALEDAYTRVTEEARNQYTIGYRTRSTPSSTFRKVEVVVHRARLRVYARDGYYPLPPGR